MESSRNHVAIPPTDRMAAAGFTQHKSPSLAEAYKHFTGKDLVGAHDALVDVLATIEIYEHVRNNNTSIQS
jgi:DNA polymerase-3 subunit epsilon